MGSPTSSDGSSQFGDSLGDFLSIYPSSSPIHPQDNLSFAYSGVRQYNNQDITVSANQGLFDYSQQQGFGFGPPSSGLVPRAAPQLHLPSNQPSQSNFLTPTYPTSGKSSKASSISHEASPDDMDADDASSVETVPPLPPNATSEERAIWLRRKNTLSARKNRKIRAMKAQQLEEQATQLSLEKEIWKTRAETLRGLLTSHGIPCPNWEE
ncbi:hypothetical protein DL96DRAFT_1706133 [Flagelloscypha sp. PMI_526]|nr:hypothetical protein DL96DRAFT_1706133 [Flagelloscypha sp. PMI_526]